MRHYSRQYIHAANKGLELLAVTEQPTKGMNLQLIWTDVPFCIVAQHSHRNYIAAQQCKIQHKEHYFMTHKA